MITRPLELAAHMRAQPRNFDLLFVVNAGLLALFFTLFGSRFVLSPSLSVDFEVPGVAGASPRPVGSREVVISVDRAGLMYVNEGKLNSVDELRQWLKSQSQRKPGEKLRPSLQILATANVSLSDLTQVISEAKEAGFEDVGYVVKEMEAGAAGRKP